MKLQLHPATNTTKVLITGLPGSGKSTLAAQLASTYKLIWIDLEKGASTLTKLPPEWQDRIDLIAIPDSASFPVASDTLTQLFKSGSASICHTHGKAGCGLCRKDNLGFDLVDLNSLDSGTIVVVDSITQLSHSILAHITRNSPVDYKPERDDWGSLRKLTEFFCSQFQAARYNLICIAHVTEAKLDDGRTKLVPSFGSAAMSAEIGKAFDHIVYCETVNGKHKSGSSTSYSNSVLTKSRTDFRIEDLAIPSLIPLFRLPSTDIAVTAVTTQELPDLAAIPTKSELIPAATVAQVSAATAKLAALRAKITASK